MKPMPYIAEMDLPAILGLNRAVLSQVRTKRMVKGEHYTGGSASRAIHLTRAGFDLLIEELGIDDAEMLKNAAAAAIADPGRKSKVVASSPAGLEVRVSRIMPHRSHRPMLLCKDDDGNLFKVPVPSRSVDKFTVGMKIPITHDFGELYKLSCAMPKRKGRL